MTRSLDDHLAMLVDAFEASPAEYRWLIIVGNTMVLTPVGLALRTVGPVIIAATCLTAMGSLLLAADLMPGDSER